MSTSQSVGENDTQEHTKLDDWPLGSSFQSMQGNLCSGKDCEMDSFACSLLD